MSFRETIRDDLDAVVFDPAELGEPDGVRYVRGADTTEIPRAIVSDVTDETLEQGVPVRTTRVRVGLDAISEIDERTGMIELRRGGEWVRRRIARVHPQTQTHWIVDLK